MGRCCFDGYKVQGVVWINPDTIKATATRSSYLYIRPTTKLLYQGAEQARKTRPEVTLDALDHGAQGCRFDSSRGCLLFTFNLAIMKKIYSCAHSVSVLYLRYGIESIYLSPYCVFKQASYGDTGFSIIPYA